MKIFLSWSKEPSKSVAAALYVWLKDVIQSLDPWMSDQDIQSGERWAGTIGTELEKHNFGILILTTKNQFESWINFEAGALSKVLGTSRVVPYLFNFKLADLSAGPLTQFHGREATKEGTLRLLKDINALIDRPLDEPQLLKAFELNWPFLEEKLQKISESFKDDSHSESAIVRTDNEKLDELIVLMRNFDRTLSKNEYYGTKRRKSFTKPDPYSLQSYFYVIRDILDNMDVVKEYEIEHDAMFINVVVDDLREDALIEEEVRNALYPTTHGEYKVAIENARKHRNRFKL
ncbi:TIR domain-containing protein [Deinococcus phoenicis]|uniref:TIR domain-containing protein n=1 Tax=Deinococcus phoenicis TaxID=1476583 RepID=UPI001378BF42|nr:TIR domain-containing protein [Deinococcus phoenicis]